MSCRLRQSMANPFRVPVAGLSDGDSVTHPLLVTLTKERITSAVYHWNCVLFADLIGSYLQETEAKVSSVSLGY